MATIARQLGLVVVMASSLGACSSFTAFGDDCPAEQPAVECYDPCTYAAAPLSCEEGEWRCLVAPAYSCEADCGPMPDFDCIDCDGNLQTPYCDLGSWQCPEEFACPEPEEGGRALWSTSFGSDVYERLSHVAMDANGRVIVAGDYTASLSSLEDAELVSVGGWDAYVAVFDELGALEWSLPLGESGDDLVQGLAYDPSSDTMVLAVSRASQTSQPAASGPVSIMRLASDGTVLWDKELPASFGMLAKHHLAVGPDGDIVIAGSFSGPLDLGGGVLPYAGGTDVFVAKLDADGNHVWSTSFGGTAYDYVEGVDVDVDGNVFVTGSFSGNLPFLNSSHIASDYFDGYMLKLGDDGSPQWFQHLAGVGSVVGASVAGYDDGGAVMVGAFGKQARWVGPSDDFTVSGTTERNALVARVDASGSVSFTQIIDGASDIIQGLDRWSLAVDELGDIVVAGQFVGTTSFAIPQTSAGDYDALLLKLDAQLAPKWSFSFGDDNANIAQGVAVGGSNASIALVGAFWGTMDLGNGNLPSFSEGASYVAYFNPTGKL